MLWGVNAYSDQHADLTRSQIDYQLRRLMSPTVEELAAEKNGGVYIYDSLDAIHVDAALDQHFDRIEHMMFTRIHHLPPTGAGPAVVEDDGCD